MKRELSSTKLTSSEKYFVNDLYQLIVSSASDPAIMMAKLSSTLREFISAEEIILFECIGTKSPSHQMLSQLHIKQVLANYHLELADYAHSQVFEITQYDEFENEVIERLLTKLNYRDVIIVPIYSKHKRLGCMHVFGSFQESISSQFFRLFTAITPLLGVILENYQLFNQMEQLLQERTIGLNEANKELETLINTVPDLIITTNRKLIISNIFNYSIEEYYFTDIKAGFRFQDFITQEQYQMKLEYIEQLKDDDICVFIEEVLVGENINYLENRIKRTKDNYLHIIRNITEKVLGEQKIRFMNQYDQLTGLNNRNMFYNLFDNFKEAGVTIGILLVDMNGLKLINETLGFSVGDQYLMKLSDVCKSVISDGVFLFRVGDDEIAFLLSNATSASISQIVTKLSFEIEKLNTTVFKTFPLSVATGYYIDKTGDKDHEYIFNMAENALNQDKLLHSESNKSAVVKTLTKALEARDFITEGHADRMEELLDIFGQAMAFDPMEITKLRLFGKFHDIGKVGISDTILFKPGKLTDEEMSEMKKHSEIGYKIAQSAADLHVIADLILKHHERYDGTGYPIGLTANEIPIECRILSIVDAYDAMTNNRPYRKAMSKEAAIDELNQNKRLQFDPELVDFFIENVLI